MVRAESNDRECQPPFASLTKQSSCLYMRIAQNYEQAGYKMIIVCPECGGKVSDKASACPHCGFDFAAQRALAQKRESEKVAERQRVLDAERQKEYDAQFTPNAIYLALPWPLKPLARPLVFSGRAPRIEFWSFMVLYVGVIVGAIVLFSPEGLLAQVLAGWMFYGGICAFSCMFRRSHDAGGEGPQAFMFVLAFVCLLIPIIGWLVFWVFLLGGLGLVQESESGSNEYGPNPFTFYNGESSICASATMVSETSRRLTQMTQIRCPYCGQIGETDVHIELHQRVKCPFCGQKFSYEG